MQYIRAAVDESHARGILGRGRGMAFRRRWAKWTDPKRAARYPQTELVWLPCYLVTIQLESPSGRERMVCGVEGRSGSFSLLDVGDSLAEGEPEGLRLGPIIDADAAEAVARRELVHVILRRRGRAGKPTPRETLEVRQVAYPYWVYYYRRGKYIDVRILDAATGQLAGNKIRLAVLDGLKESNSE